MTKKEIVKHIAERARLPQLQTKEVVQMTFDAIIETLVSEGRIELRNFGVFVVKTRKARMARNPKKKDGDAFVYVEAKNVVTFQPGKVMEEMVRKSAKPRSRRKSSKDEPEPVAALQAGTEAGGPADDFGASGDLPRKPR